MKEFEKNKNEFLIFLKKDRGYSDQTIQSYSRDLNAVSYTHLTLPTKA